MPPRIKNANNAGRTAKLPTPAVPTLAEVKPKHKPTVPAVDLGHRNLQKMEPVDQAARGDARRQESPVSVETRNQPVATSPENDPTPRRKSESIKPRSGDSKFAGYRADRDTLRTGDKFADDSREAK